MATIVLQAAGAALGALFGPVGAVIGRAAGALAGYAIDQSLFGEHRTVDGARLSDLDMQTSQEGSAIPRVYGRARITGEMIWATRLEEVVSEQDAGGKGAPSGTTVRNYTYYANFAIGLCEGPIAAIGRVWADGKPFSLRNVTHRIYLGDDEQLPDSLIEAKQGDGNAPAYRGTAYIVFERMALEDFGNRVPVLSFEVIRPVGALEKKIRAVTLIPGATEFGYDPEPVREVIGPGSKRGLNRHLTGIASDWSESLDQLQALCPNLESVGLVATWFGDDLRAGHCTLRPGVTTASMDTMPAAWSAGGVAGAGARVVSQYEGAAAFGGTPSDASVVRAIRDLKGRGLKVLFYPFVMMDVPAGNGLSDPYGGEEQPAYPWRGTITASIAPGREGSPDKTSAVADEIADFVGTADAGDFSISGGAVHYSGPAEWSFRRLILHYAHLCKAAGGVDAFLLCSELRGLTTLRSDASTYPFVDALVTLAAEVRAVLGPATRLSYGADWSEYFGHQPADGSGDVHFHLDSLWASDDVDFVGIDNYMPLADWRDGSVHLDAADWASGRSVAYLRANITGGEDFDWYYASAEDRDAQVRSPITDGAGKPWVFRPKDLKGWWGNQHFNRPGGVEADTPTAWMPEGKPIVFTEIGCPAVDKGANQPNVFPDPKSSASALPYYSSGARDDLMQRRFLAAAAGYWDTADPAYVAGSNPLSTAYGAPMVEAGAMHVWTWDARPYPAFPYRLDVWSDGGNWQTGHWLTGRLGATAASDLVAAILADYGIAGAEIGELDGILDGYVIGDVTSARGALEPLAGLLMFEAAESGEVVRFVPRLQRAVATLSAADLAEDGDDKPLLTVRRAQETELPAEIGIGFSDALADYRASAATARRLVTGSRRTQLQNTGAVMRYAAAASFADTILQDLWAGRATYSFALGHGGLAIEPGDVCDLATADEAATLLVTRVEDGLVRRIEGRSIDPAVLSPVAEVVRENPPAGADDTTAPLIVLLDLPLMTGSEPGWQPYVAAFANPWPGAMALAVGTPDTGFVARQGLSRRATVGELTAPLPAGPLARWDEGNAIQVRLYGGSLASAADVAVLNGANLAAIGLEAGSFEVIQFRTATLTGADTWRLSGLLRGQGGTSDVMALGHAAGARFVLLDRAVELLQLREAESGLALTLRAGAAGTVYDPDTFTDVTLAAARRGLRCLPPVHVSATRDASSGDVTFGWVRQSRIGGDAWDLVEIPLGETAESYRVEILDGGDVVRAIAASAPSAIYAHADQVADFGTAPDEIKVRVSQVSPTEGAGTAIESLLHV
jgi:hypothetical protein